MKARIGLATSIAVAVGAITLLVLHAIKPVKVQVDFVSVGLLAIILMSPYVSLIRRIKLWDFEAEIGPERVAALEDKVKPISQQSPKEKISPISINLFQLAESEPALAIAKLGMELERKLQSLAELSLASDNEQNISPNHGMGSLARLLAKSGIIDQRVYEALRAVIEIRNRAVHGGRIEPSDAVRVVDSGLSLLGYLEKTIEERRLTPTKSEPITGQQEDEARRALYRVTTIVPYVDKPEKRTYVMTQDQLDAFLSGYDEYAEYVTSIALANEGNHS